MRKERQTVYVEQFGKLFAIKKEDLFNWLRTTLSENLNDKSDVFTYGFNKNFREIKKKPYTDKSVHFKDQYSFLDASTWEVMQDFFALADELNWNHMVPLYFKNNNH